MVDVVVVVVVAVVVVGCSGVCCWSSMIANKSSRSLATMSPVIAPRRMHLINILVEMFDQH